MIAYRLDHWKARARIIYTNDQHNMTSLFSPQWAGEATQEKGIRVFDGFDSTWFVPFDISSPISDANRKIAEDLEERARAMKQAWEAKNHKWGERLLLIISEEVEKRCQNQWDENKNDENKLPMVWNDVSKQYGITQRIDMIARARLIDGSAPLPGYYHFTVLDLAIDGKLVTRHVSMPLGIDSDGFLLRMDTWHPPYDEESNAILTVVWKKIEASLKHSTHMGKEKAAKLRNELEKPWFRPGVKDSERCSWIFKLNFHEKYSVSVGRAPADVKLWTEFKGDASLEQIREGTKAGRHLVVVRVNGLSFDTSRPGV